MAKNDIFINLNKLINSELEDRIVKVLEAACQLVENKAKENCPVDDGTLRASITHNIRKEGRKYEGAIGSNVEYAAYVHEGTGLYAVGGKGRQTPWTYKDAKGEYHTTSGQKPQPFLKNAIEEHKEDIKKIIKEVLD